LEPNSYNKTQNGYAGTGINVAMLDLGIDYLHMALDGSGNVTEFEENNPEAIEPGTFPTEKVVGVPTEKVVGEYDFVGEMWPLGDFSSNPDPNREQVMVPMWHILLLALEVSHLVRTSML
jgi:subtilisin family serine protease